MADTFHPEMCLHPARRAKGELGRKIDYALLWNGDCPVQQVGRPAFYGLLDLGLPVEKWELAGEHLRKEIAVHFEQVGSMTQKAVERYIEDEADFLHCDSAIIEGKPTSFTD